MGSPSIKQEIEALTNINNKMQESSMNLIE